MERTINSHIQIPKFILKNYEDQRGTLYQLDADTKEINLGHAKSINTRKGYFSNEVEEMMQRYFETPFAKLLKEIRNFDFSFSYLNVTNEFWDIIKRFILLTLARTPEMYDNIVSNTVYARFVAVKDEEKADIAVETCMTLGGETVLDEFTITFIINRSSVPFVLPMCGLYSAPFSQYSSLIYPVAPDFAITLVKGKIIQDLVEGNQIKLFMLTDDGLTRKLNCRALLEQCRFDCYEKMGNKKVISNDRDVLETLVTDYQAIYKAENK